MHNTSLLSCNACAGKHCAVERELGEDNARQLPRSSAACPGCQAPCLLHPPVLLATLLCHSYNVKALASRTGCWANRWFWYFEDFCCIDRMRSWNGGTVIFSDARCPHFKHFLAGLGQECFFIESQHSRFLLFLTQMSTFFGFFWELLNNSGSNWFVGGFPFNICPISSGRK